MTTFKATMICEGVDQPENHNQWIEAWQMLVDTGLAWQLQGFFGRQAASMIESGDIQAKSFNWSDHTEASARNP